MRIPNCKMAVIIIILLVLSSGDGSSATSVTGDLPMARSVILQTDLSSIDLTRIGHVAPKGRVQDRELNQLPLIDELLAHGKGSIPFLIGKLDDETVIDGHVFDFWYETRVGDVALVILTHFFSTADEQPTIPGVGWDEFLERGNDKASMSEAVLRNYIEKYGRRKIKARWQKIWDDNKENIFWDETERCFRVSSLTDN